MTSTINFTHSLEMVFATTPSVTPPERLKGLIFPRQPSLNSAYLRSRLQNGICLNNVLVCSVPSGFITSLCVEAITKVLFSKNCGCECWNYSFCPGKWVRMRGLLQEGWPEQLSY